MFNKLHTLHDLAYKNIFLGLKIVTEKFKFLSIISRSQKLRMFCVFSEMKYSLKQLIVHTTIWKNDRRGIPLYMNLKQGVSLIKKKKNVTQYTQKKTKNSSSTAQHSRIFSLPKGCMSFMNTYFSFVLIAIVLLLSLQRTT